MKDSFTPVRMDEQHKNWQSCIARENSLYARNNDIRTDFERDYTRLLHSTAFRRLKHKTQVFFAPQNDHICTRMEHVTHVESVSATIAKYLGLNTQLTSAIAIGHDIGHPPFGHHGENCLNALLVQKEGVNPPLKFWHERNSLFFADYIETLQDPDGVEKNLNLSYAVRDGLICHCGELDEQGVRPREKNINLYTIKRAGGVQPYTWEGCVVKISDKIAFLGRDIEDARTYHLLDMGAYRELREIVGSTLGFANKTRSGRAVNTTVLINDLIVDLCQQSSPEKGLCFSEPYMKFILELKKFNFAHIYNHWRLMEFERYATNVIESIYRTLIKTWPYAKTGRIASSLRYYPQTAKIFEDWLIKYSDYAPDFDVNRKHILHYDTKQVFTVGDFESYQKCIIEYISGMTDQFAIRSFQEIISF